MITRIETELAPKAIGPYSQAVQAGPLLFVSGQLPIDPATSKLCSDHIEEQTKQVLANIEAILTAAHFTFKNVVRTEIYLIDLKDFTVVNKIYGDTFTFDIKPARQTLQVAAIPLNARIEISCIAVA